MSRNISKIGKNLVEVNEDICAVTFGITIRDVMKIEKEEFTSNEVYIRGLPWVVTLMKKPPEPKDAGEWQLAIYLYAINGDKSKNWAIFAKATIKMVTSKIGTKPHEGIVGSFVYSAQCSGWGEHSFISWNKFIDPANGYINNGICKFEVKIEAGPLQDVRKDDWMKFERIERCCDCSSFGRFLITVKHFSEFVDVCSPQFELRGGIPWSILVLKSEKPATAKSGNENSIVHSLQIQLYNRLDDDDEENRSCKATMHCKILSFDPNVSPILAKIENMEFKSPYVCKLVDLIDWDVFINPEKRFIQDDSIVIEIEIKIESVDGFATMQIKAEQLEHQNDAIETVPTKKRRMSEVNYSRVEMECYICSDNMIGRIIVMTKCGHMYCRKCIEKSIRSRPICPSCKAKAAIRQLRPVHLPVILKT